MPVIIARHKNNWGEIIVSKCEKHCEVLHVRVVSCQSTEIFDYERQFDDMVDDLREIVTAAYSFSQQAAWRDFQLAKSLNRVN